jgi:hypothetical protein
MFHSEPFALDTVRAPTRAILKPDPFGFDKAYGFQQGQMMSTDAFGQRVDTGGQRRA